MLACEIYAVADVCVWLFMLLLADTACTHKNGPTTSTLAGI